MGWRVAAAGLMLAGGTAAAAAEFACLNPSHHDGDAIRCQGESRSMRLYGIDAPEMPGACRPGRRCTPGDPFAARDHLAGLTRGRTVICNQLDTDSYGRAIVRCSAGGSDLSCAMVADGFAVKRYGPIDCGGAAPAATASGRSDGPDKRYYAPAEPDGATDFGWLWLIVPLWLIAINIASWIAMVIDKQRALDQVDNDVQRIPESTLLLLAAAGGSPATIAAQRVLRHKSRKQPFGTYLLTIAGIQAGALAGLLLLPLVPV